MSNKYKIAIIFEGDEEECLFDIANECDGINEVFEMIPINAHGAGNIPPLFHECYSNPVFDCAVAIYDVDNRANELNSPFKNVREQLITILGDEDAVDSVSFCTNPDILQILLMGCGSPEMISLQSASKKLNSPIVSKYWPLISTGKKQDGKVIKSGYNASTWQLEIIKNSYIYDESPSYNYEDLLENSFKLSSNYKIDLPSSNVQILLHALKTGNIHFFEVINKKIKEGE